MSKKKSKQSKKLVIKPWCWYCLREFEDEKGEFAFLDVVRSLSYRSAEWIVWGIRDGTDKEIQVATRTYHD